MPLPKHVLTEVLIKPTIINLTSVDPCIIIQILLE